MQFNSLRFKTSVLYTSILGVVLFIYSAVIYYDIRNVLYRDLDEDLRIKANEISDIIRAYEQLGKIESHPVGFITEFLSQEQVGLNKRTIIDELWHSEVKTLNLKNDYIVILSSAGNSILVSENVKEDIEALFKKNLVFSTRQMTFKDLIDKNHKLRAINFPIKYKENFYIVVQIGTPLSSALHVLDKLLLFMFLTVILVLFLTSFLGAFFVKNILKSVRSITEIANNISHKELSVRIEEYPVDQEIKYLIASLNTMLTRLEKSFEHINEFSSHVAHELKTPLAIIRGEIELALNDDRDKEEYKRALQVSLEEVSRLIKIIKDLLLLAKLDYKPDIFNFEKFNLSEFIRDIYENSKILSLDKNIDVTLQIANEDFYISGDKVHLRRLFFNLIGNAVKFTPKNGKIQMSLIRQDKQAVITIADTGVGISPEDIKKIFTKFFRVKGEDQSPEFGSGLGLTIALSIARAHDGDIHVKSELGQGTTFTVTLPLV